MKKLQIVKLVAAILLLVSLFCSIDLGLNVLYNAEPSAHDNSYGVSSILHALFGIFGDSGWTYDAFFSAFKSSIWITFDLLVLNLILRGLKGKED